MINATGSTTPTAAIGDSGTIVETTSGSATTYTIPPHSSVPFAQGAQIDLVQTGAGQLTIAAGAGVTIHSDTSKLKIAVQYGAGTIYQTETQDTWVLAGNLA